MYAIIESGGLQFRVERERKFRIPKLEAEVGAPVSLPNVLMVSDGKSTLIGTPYLEGAQVKATLVAHGKHDKIIVYKYKRRKNYRRKRGHRQDYSEIMVTEIVSPELTAREAVREKEPEPPPKKKAEAKKPKKVATREKKVAKPKLKTAGKKTTKRTAAKKPKKPSAAAGKKKSTGGVIGRLRRKSKKE